MSLKLLIIPLIGFMWFSKPEKKNKFDPVQDRLECHTLQIQGIIDEMEFIKERIRILEKENL